MSCGDGRVRSKCSRSKWCSLATAELERLGIQDSTPPFLIRPVPYKSAFKSYSAGHAPGGRDAGKTLPRIIHRSSRCPNIQRARVGRFIFWATIHCWTRVVSQVAVRGVAHRSGRLQDAVSASVAVLMNQLYPFCPKMSRVGMPFSSRNSVLTPSVRAV